MRIKETVMRTTAFLAALSIGVAPIALAADTHTSPERPMIPAEAEATLADCQAWLDQLGELVELADPPISEEVRAKAEEDRDRVAQFCEEGNYHAGISLAAETIERIEEDADVTQPDLDAPDDEEADDEDAAD
jgi:hypothetical protein